MDLDAIASAPAPEPSTSTSTSSSSSSSSSPVRPPQRSRAESFGGSRCKVQFRGKEKASKLGKRFKLVDTAPGAELYRCENEPIGASAYWDNRRVCKECHDLGRVIHKRRQIQEERARQAAASGMQNRQLQKQTSNGTPGAPANARQSSDERSREVTSTFLAYFYSYFKDKVINVPNGHEMAQGVKELLVGIMPLVKKGRVKLGKDMMKYLQRKVEEIIRGHKSQTDLFAYVFRQTMEKMKQKERERTHNHGGSSSEQFNIQTLNVNIDDIKMETVFAGVLTEHEQYDEMILEAEPSTEEVLKCETLMKAVDVSSKEIHVLDKDTLRQQMKNACASTR